MRALVGWLSVTMFSYEAVRRLSPCPAPTCTLIRSQVPVVVFSGASSVVSNRDRAMRRLMLLRHAKTESDAPSGEDIDRRLDQRGHDDAAAIGRWLAQHNYPADWCWSPPRFAPSRPGTSSRRCSAIRPRAQVAHLAELYIGRSRRYPAASSTRCGEGCAQPAGHRPQSRPA